MKNRRGAGFEIRKSVLWLVSDGVGEEDVNVLLAIVRARLAAKKSRSSFAKEKVRNFIRIEISLKSSLLGGWAIELGKAIPLLFPVDGGIKNSRMRLAQCSMSS